MKTKLLVISLLAGSLSTASADQTDPDLVTLFEGLKTAENTLEIGLLSGEIWKLWISSDDEEAQTLMDQGITEMSARELPTATQTFTSLIELKPNFAEAWNKRATVYYMAGELDLSIEDVKQTLMLEPRHFGALSGLGLIYTQMEDYASAEIAFEKALEVNPHMEGVKMNLEYIRNKLKQQAA
ncbi:MAG: tetratricopeptide repeat protein [Arenicellales bacterium WSBS_2016_MAG_OTU3]